jgi:hypothetical protein
MASTSKNADIFEIITSHDSFRPAGASTAGSQVPTSLIRDVKVVIPKDPLKHRSTYKISLALDKHKAYKAKSPSVKNYTALRFLALDRDWDES